MTTSGPPPTATPALPTEGWYRDPRGAHEYRFWNGTTWTNHVSTGGRQATDPFAPGPPPAPTAGGDATAAATPAATAAVRDSPSPADGREGKVPLFGARALARDLQAEVASLRAELDRLAQLGVLSVAELEQRRDALQREVDASEVTLAQEREEATAALARERADAESRLRNDLSEATDQRDNLLAELTSLRGQVVVTREEAVLQEVGIYEYRHPLSDAVAYKAELARLKDKIKTMGRKDGGAVLAATDWTVNGSSSQGRTMVGNYSKLILRAYNAEADNLVRGLKPYKLDSSVDRLTKVTATIEKLGKTMNIRIAEDYHDLRVRELELTADYLEKLAEEKEREREEKERLKEERKVQQEMERERARLEKERQHYENAVTALVAKGDDEGAARLREQVSDIDRRIEDVDYRAANIRAGYVYVISNVGTFGDRIIKVGLTRRLEPRDRVRELGDASVPFRFDIHALFFADDAVGIESALHARLADRRVNLVNLRREFFYATPQEVREHLRDLKGDLLEFEEMPEALEYHQSVTQAALSQAAAPDHPDAQSLGSQRV